MRKITLIIIWLTIATFGHAASVANCCGSSYSLRLLLPEESPYYKGFDSGEYYFVRNFTLAGFLCPPVFLVQALIYKDFFDYGFVFFWEDSDTAERKIRNRINENMPNDR